MRGIALQLALGTCALWSLACDASHADEVSFEREAGLDAGRAEDALDAAQAQRPLDAAPVAYAPLVAMEGFRRYDASLDPLPTHQPATIVCAPGATLVELGGFEVDTGRCNYLLSSAPALRHVAVGATVRVSLLHFDLSAPEPAQAHVAVLFGDTVQWEDTIPIPSRAGAIDARFVTTVPLEPGDPLRLHLHNHGGNTYLLEALEVLETP